MTNYKQRTQFLDIIPTGLLPLVNRSCKTSESQALLEWHLSCEVLRYLKSPLF